MAYLHECSGPFLKEHCREVFGVTPLQSTVTPNTSLAAHEKTVTKGVGYYKDHEYATKGSSASMLSLINAHTY